MKKYFSMNVLVLLFFTIGFIACSEDDVNDLLYTGKDAKIFVDGSEVKVYHVNAGLFPSFFEFTLYLKDDDLIGDCFFGEWDTKDLSSIKVGDDITKYSNFSFEYRVGYNSYGYSPNRSNLKGSMTVTKIKLNKKEISLEAKNMYMYHDVIIGKTAECVVNGTINLKYKIDK